MLFSGALYALLQLTSRLAQAAYDGDFSAYSGKVLYSSTVCEKMKPVFYIYTQDDALFIIVRGSQDSADFATDTIFSETRTENRMYFHTGFYNASLYVLETARNYIKDFKGKVYFCGHSYGAACSQVMHVLIHQEFPDVDAYSFAYAPVPSMDMQADDDIRDRMYAFVNSDDIIPTLSIPNCYQRFTFLFPTLSAYETDTIINRINTLLKIVRFTSLVETEMFNMIWDAVPIIVTAAKEYEAGAPKYVRYISGTAYQLYTGSPAKLSESKINQEIFLNKLSISLSCITDHSCSNYVQAIEELIEE